MKYILILLATVSINAHSGTCETLSDLSGSIMKARQAGVSMQNAIEIANDGKQEALNRYTRLQVMSAYDSPRFSSDEYQMRAISDFSDKAYLECIRALGDKK